MTARIPRSSWPVRAADRAAAALGDRRLSLDPDQLIARARRRTGLRDLGAPPAEEPLFRLCADLDRGGLRPIGRLAARGMLDQLVATRLELTPRLARAGHAAIERPLFIVGPPRTGTTFLHRLLACDPSARCLSEAEALYLPGTRRQRPRAATYALFQRLSSRLVPGLARRHDRRDPTAPEEEIALLARSFTCSVFGMFCDLPDYDRWLGARAHADWLEVYRYHRRQLELVEASRPGGFFVLKTPAHGAAPTALLEIYPDALLVQTDRDPADVAESLLDLELHARALFTAADRYDAEAAGRCVLAFLRGSIDRMTEGRRMAPDRVVTVRYRDLIEDPLAQVRRLYEAWRRPLTDDAVSRMRGLLSRQHGSARSPRRDRLASWGLSAESVRGACSWG